MIVLEKGLPAGLAEVEMIERKLYQSSDMREYFYYIQVHVLNVNGKQVYHHLMILNNGKNDLK